METPDNPAESPATQIPEISAPEPQLPSANKRETWIAVGILSLCLVTAIGNWTFGLTRKPETEKSKTTAAQGLAERLLAEEADLGVITIEGTIMHQADSGSFGGGNAATPERIIKALHQAEKEGVKGIILKINSPGGTAAASQAIYGELMKAKKRSKLKIVASMGDVAASGGYYIASAADKIVANPATLTGSIGVIAQFTQIKGLFEKLGLQATVIKSGKHKDIGSPYRDPSPEDIKIMKSIIDDSYEDFLEAISQGRKLPKEKIRPLADGRIYTGNQAFKHQLVDQLGDYYTAVELLKKMTQLDKDAEVKDYTKPGFDEFLNMLNTKVSVSQTVDDLTQAELRKLSNIPLMLYF